MLLDLKLSRKKVRIFAILGCISEGPRRRSFLLFNKSREKCVAVDTSTLTNNNKEDRT